MWRDRLIIFGLITLTLALRLWHLDGYLVFLGDEGRDVLVARQILHGKFTLLGPTASVGGFYMGPIYYYFMAPFLWLFRGNPVGPAVMVVFFQAATVGLIYLFGRRFLNWRAGLVSALVYTLSPLTIKYGISSWNPNILPFFSLLTIGALVWSLRFKLGWPAVLAGFSWGIALQLHYLALILGPIALVLAFFDLNVKRIAGRLLGFFLGWLTGLAPFLFFEIRHGFPNTRTIWRFLFGQAKAPVGFGEPVKLFGQMVDLAKRLNAWFLGYPLDANREILVYLASGFLILLVLTLLIRRRSDALGFATIAVWWLVGLLGLSFYQGQIHDYYLTFLFPCFALVIGNFFGRLLSWFPVSLIALGSLVYLIGHLVGVLPLVRQQPNFQLDQSRQVAGAVLNHRQGRQISPAGEYNFALVSEHNSDHAYRYFFEAWDQPPLPLDQKVTSQLMIICEEENCPVLGNSLWEIAGFGRAEIAGVWQVRGGIEIYRLVHHPESASLIGKPAPKG